MDNTLDLVFTNDAGVFEARKRDPLLNSDHCIIRILPKVYGKQHKKVFSHLGKKTQHRLYAGTTKCKTPQYHIWHSCYMMRNPLGMIR
uniref:Uncharacterized protein n=1 Tax=Trichobilharzia regenti TaxID=157069 RepID=A0AA85K7V0_TRIRE|nr:unnamed protein product [Trichobilharzia regenti]